MIYKQLNLLMQTADASEKSLVLGKTESRRRGRQRMRWPDGITEAVNINLSKLRDSEGQGGLVRGVAESDTTGQLNSKLAETGQQCLKSPGFPRVVCKPSAEVERGPRNLWAFE